jgi:hypothetical protein
MNEDRGSCRQNRGRVIEKKGQMFPFRQPVLQEIIRKHLIAFSPEAERIIKLW